MKTRREILQYASILAGALAAPVQARAESAPGVTDSEIKFGQAIPLSGPASGYSVVGRAESAFFRMINEQGGVNGRKLNFLSVDDAYSPPKSFEQTRRLVEQEGVAFVFNSIGTATNFAVRDYLNEKKVPQLFSAFGIVDPAHYPWTLPFYPIFESEARIYGKYIPANKPDAKIAVLFQNDFFGKSYLKGLQDGLGPEHANLIVRTESYEVSEPTIDSQIIKLQDSGADTLLIAATPKFAAQAIRKTFELGWSATRFVPLAATSIASVLKPAGLEKSVGLINAGYLKDVTDPRWKDDQDVRDYAAFIAKYMQPRDYDGSANYGYQAAILLVDTLKRCGDDLSRENIMRKATSIKDLELPLMLPGVRVNTSPTDYRTIRQFHLARFDGASWSLFGDLMSD